MRRWSIATGLLVFVLAVIRCQSGGLWPVVPLQDEPKDLAMPADLVSSDLVRVLDMAVPADLAMPADLAAPDLAMPVDLAMPTDMRPGDAMTSDLSDGSSQDMRPLELMDMSGPTG